MDSSAIIKGLAKDTRTFLRIVWNWRHYRRLRTFCMFVGYPRTGHTLLRTLLDAHPEMALANEVHVLGKVMSGLTQGQLFDTILRNNRNFGTVLRGAWAGYEYHVPNQWGGRFTRLRVIGDKDAGRTANTVRQRPKCLVELKRAISLPVRFIHLMRNPYDVIATMSVKDKRPLSGSIHSFTVRCQGVARLKKEVDHADIIDVRLESLISEPERILEGACRFLGVECMDDYLRDCASVVFDAPRITRGLVAWRGSDLAKVKELIGKYAWFRGYTFEGDAHPDAAGGDASR